MLVPTSYKDPEITQKINTAVGKPFSVWQRIQHKGVGSPKLQITAASKEIQTLLSQNNDRNCCNIELRPKGILVGFHVRLATYALVIPYYKLTLYKGTATTYSLYIDHHFIRFNATKKDTAIHVFVKKILTYKAEQKPEYIDDF